LSLLTTLLSQPEGSEPTMSVPPHQERRPSQFGPDQLHL
jgi:hypothetical protein